MSEFNNDNRGVLFKNDKKGNDNAPDYKGSIMVTPDMVGKELDLAAWIKKSQKGTTYMSLSVSAKWTQQPQEQAQPQSGFQDDELSDLPF